MIELTTEELKQRFSDNIFKRISETADELGLECYVVGGYVRDIFLQRPSKDIDVVVVGSGIAMAEALAKRLGRGAHLSVFKNFGTAQLKYHGTEVEFVQVSFSNDDSYEWFGGTVNCRYLVAYKGWDDEFDTDNGFSGTVQYCLSIRDPRIADTSQSNGFESDNNASGTETAPFTTATFKNITFIGPKTALNTDFANTSDYITGGSVYPDNGSKLGKFQSAMQIRRSSRLNCENSLAVGYPIGLIIDGEKGNTPKYAKEGGFTLKNIIFAGMDIIGSDGNKIYEDHLSADGKNITDGSRISFSHEFFVNDGSLGTTYANSINNAVKSESELGLTDPMNTGQKYCPASILSDGNNGYIGAFKDANDDWMKGWTNFDPQNTVY